MQFDRLQDRQYRALGKAARHTGRWADAYRPKGAMTPLAPENRYLRLPVAFEPMPGGSSGDSLEQIFWRGIFDGHYTKAGDYIQLDGRPYFISSQEPLQPIICVRTNRVVSVSRS